MGFMFCRSQNGALQFPFPRLAACQWLGLESIHHARLFEAEIQGLKFMICDIPYKAM